MCGYTVPHVIDLYKCVALLNSLCLFVCREARDKNPAGVEHCHRPNEPKTYSDRKGGQEDIKWILSSTYLSSLF